MTPRIELHDVSKRYVKYNDTPLLVSSALRFWGKTRREELWALRDVSFDVREGECLGVIGRNGSGKSTLLRMLAGVTAPTVGSVAVRGRIAPLISVGVGFHGELTGRENIYVSGTVLGMSPQEIDDRFDEIVDFAEIEGFIDTPVKFYSSGMFVRLGFAVSIVADPDVLLIDEVLAVGDLAFQLKCFDRMKEIRDSGTTIVLVSHNLSAIRLMCDRTILLHRSDLRHDGRTDEAISLFHELLGEDRDIEGPDAGRSLEDEGAAYKGRIVGLTVIDEDGAATRHVEHDREVRVRVEVTFDEAIPNALLGLLVEDSAGTNVASASSRYLEGGFEFAPGVQHTVEISARPRLVTGTYTCQPVITDLAGVPLVKPQVIEVYVSGDPYSHGYAELDMRFRILQPGSEDRLPG